MDFNKFCNVQVSLRMRFCERVVHADSWTDYLVAHWSCASWSSGLDGDYICLCDCEEEREEGYQETVFADARAVSDELLVLHIDLEVRF